MSNRQRLTFAAIAAVIGVVALIALGGGSGDPESERAASTPAATATANSSPEESATAEPSETPTAEPTETPEPEPEIRVIAVKGGKVVGGVADVDFKEGDAVRFAVKSDVADEIHVHGYDERKEVEAGGTAKFNFKATIPGVFEVELEGAGIELARLRVEQ